MKPVPLRTRLGEGRYRMLRVPGYHLYRAGRWIAAYEPEFSWIITNPFVPKRLVNRALLEEFCHNSMCSSRPAQLHPVINWLNGSAGCPGPDEYRDLVEAIAVVACPLARSKAVSKRNLPRAIPKKYRDLGSRIIDIAIGFSKKADATFLPSDARCRMLWAIITYLSYVVPLVPNQGPRIIAFLESLRYPRTWSNDHDVFEFLLAMTARLVRSHRPTDLGFTITHPRDPHVIISSMLQMFEAARSIPLVEHETRMEILQSVFPLLLHEITLGNSGIVPLFWLRARGNEIATVVEVWDETPGWLTSTQQSISLALRGHSPCHQSCGARRIYQEIYKTIERFTRTDRLDPYRLFQKMMTTTPEVVTKYFDFGSNIAHDCFHCRKHLLDAKTACLGRRFTSMPDSFRRECVEASRKYEGWLIHEGLEYISASLNTNLTLSLRQISPLVVRWRKSLLPWVHVISPDAHTIHS